MERSAASERLGPRRVEKILAAKHRRREQSGGTRGKIAGQPFQRREPEASEAGGQRASVARRFMNERNDLAGGVEPLGIEPVAKIRAAGVVETACSSEPGRERQARAGREGEPPPFRGLLRTVE